MPDPIENRCCHTSDESPRDTKRLQERLVEAGGKCITEHLGFKACCLNIHVLEMSLFVYSSKPPHGEGPLGDDEPIHQ